LYYEINFNDVGLKETVVRKIFIH